MGVRDLRLTTPGGIFRHHPDPVMFYKVEKEGEYMIEIKDVLYRGRDDFVYRLGIGSMPYVTHIFPLGSKRGSEAQVELHGINLPTDKTSLKLTDDCPSRRSVQLTANGSTTNPLPFAVGDLPEAVETEPNEATEQATRIEVPVTVNGRIGSPGDVDRFVFAAKAKQSLVMEVHARRLDSPLDSILSVFDSNGRKLRENDDTTDESAGLVTHHADSYLAYTFPSDADYVLQVRDIQGMGGDEYAYRLTVASSRPDYVLRLQPDNPRSPQGGTAVFGVKAFRRNGFNGEIKLSIQGLPEGFVGPDAVIPQKQKQARMAITAPLEAPVGLVSPKIVGTAVDDKAPAAHEAAEKAAKDAETAAAAAKAAADKAAAAQAGAQQAAAAKRKQANEAKKKLDDLVANQQQAAEANLAAATKAVTDATPPKGAADKALADAKAAIAQPQQAQQAAEKAAQEAEANAKAAGEDANKPEEEKKKAAADAAAKRKAAADAAAALSQARQNEQQAQSQANTAAQKLAQAEARKKSAGEAVANVKNQVPPATNAQQAAEKAATEAEAAAATAKAGADKARGAQAAAEKPASEKRNLANEAKARLAQTIVREAVPSEDRMQAFYYMHSVPTREFLLAVLERGEFTLALDMPPAEVLEVPARGRCELVVKASFKEGVTPDTITLKPSAIPKEWQIKAPPIPVGQTQCTITITTFGNRFVRAGQTGSLIITATMKVGKQTISGFVPVIPYEVQ